MNIEQRIDTLLEVYDKIDQESDDAAVIIQDIESLLDKMDQNIIIIRTRDND